ncbi:YwpF family protein [Metasolibacillus fluoroglycofenilyticus]|uniref:YwpF family protein n=1 Tax=Metasolibacillus fluoroglycofenilyticus TaxID=1239396 RepID=UPI000D377624|nr:YwpF family protein [Metasolibacillus fluoroglycofenilyticus]
MKTFKLMAFDLLTDDTIQPIRIIDGLTINLEDSHQSWVLELFIPNEYHSIFKTLQENNSVFDAHAVISFPDNEPAPFSLIVSTITEIGDRLSVLLKGSIKARRQKYAELLLQQLLEEGLSNDELLQRFQHDMKERPKLNRQQ